MAYPAESDLVNNGFLEEARGYAPAVNSSIEALVADISNREALQEIFRLAHTIRGASAASRLEDVASIAQSAEELAEAILNGDIPMDTESIDLFREAFSGLF